MSLYVAERSRAIAPEQLSRWVVETIRKTGKSSGRMLVLPPDHTRLNSRAGGICRILWEQFSDTWDITFMPALGTHNAMTDEQLRLMFGDTIPRERFLVHDWRNDVLCRGVVGSDVIRDLSAGKLDFDVRVEVNKILFDGYDLILSVGQVVPHEVVGMANYTKNILVGVGGSDIINKSHFLGAVSGMESIMGRADSPVRRLFNYGVDSFLRELPIVYMLTVMGKNSESGDMEMRGFFSGDSVSAFEQAAEVSVDENISLLDRPVRKAVVFLDPEEFTSTWLGNKAIYRTRMAIADHGELIILAPGLKEFGEDPEIDRLIRKFGYRGTSATLAAVAHSDELRANLGAAAHLIHGSGEDRFTITYCPGPEVSADEIRSVGFQYGDLQEQMRRYDVEHLTDGWNTVAGEEIFYISNPALGLWALESNFK